MRRLTAYLTPLRQWRASLCALWVDQRGSMLPTIAGSITMLLGTTGVAVDGARIYYVQDVLQRSLDAAGLAAGNAADLDNLQTDAQKFFDANFLAAGDVASAGELQVAISNENRLITLTATATVEPTFMRLFGFDEFSISANTEVTRETRGMELVLVADVTGSMAGQRIIDLRSAATNMINIVYGDEETNPNLFVGVVPYTTTVNISPDRDAWLSDAGRDFIALDDDNDEFFNYGPETLGWDGCVNARTGGRDTTDDPPGIAPFAPYQYPDASDNDWRDGDGPGEWTYDIDEDPGYPNSGTGPNIGCPSPILPLVAERTTVTTKIQSLQPWRRGGTASAIGMAWGWRLLSPRWRGLYGGATPAANPVDYGDEIMDKVVVVLTDGQNQFFDFEGGGPAGSDHTGYGRANDFAGSNANALAEINSRFATLCNRMKDQGIIIYSITFGSTPNATTQALYRGCATNSSFYFHAPSGSDLDDAFDTIGRQLSNLRLSG